MHEYLSRRHGRPRRPPRLDHRQLAAPRRTRTGHPPHRRTGAARPLAGRATRRRARRPRPAPPARPATSTPARNARSPNSTDTRSTAIPSADSSTAATNSANSPPGGVPGRARRHRARADRAHRSATRSTPRTGRRSSLRPLPTQPSRRRTRYPDHHPRPRHPHHPTRLGHRPRPPPPRQRPAQQPVTSPSWLGITQVAVSIDLERRFGAGRSRIQWRRLRGGDREVGRGPRCRPGSDRDVSRRRSRKDVTAVTEAVECRGRSTSCHPPNHRGSHPVQRRSYCALSWPLTAAAAETGRQGRSASGLVIHDPVRLLRPGEHRGPAGPRVVRAVAAPPQPRAHRAGRR